MQTIIFCGGKGTRLKEETERQAEEREQRLREIVPAIKRGIAETRNGTPALLEFITQQS